jgi:hypothetical protein
MGVFSEFLTTKELTKIKGTIGEHQAAVREYFATRFQGKTAANTFLQQAVKEGAAKLKAKGATDESKKFAEVGGGKGEAARTDFVNAVEAAIQEAFNAVEPPPEEAPELNYETIDKRYAVPSLAAKIENMRDATTKICSIYARGKAYKGHGPTTSLGSGVLHAHVGNGDGIGFKWDGDTLVIYGYGKKSDAAPKGTSGYAWTTR